MDCCVEFVDDLSRLAVDVSVLQELSVHRGVRNFAGDPDEVAIKNGAIVGSQETSVGIDDSVRSGDDGETAAAGKERPVVHINCELEGVWRKIHGLVGESEVTGDVGVAEGDVKAEGESSLSCEGLDCGVDPSVLSAVVENECQLVERKR